VTADAISVENNCGSGFSGTAAFGYDRAGQVTSVDQASASTTDVSYDPAGNLTELTHDPSAPVTYTQQVNAAGETTSQTPTTQGPASSSFAYDSIGAETSASVGSATTTYGYDSAGQMTTSTTSAGTTTYAYGEGGLLATETAPGAAAPRQLTWGGTHSLPLLVSDSTDDFLYGPTSTPVEQVNVTASPPASNPAFVNYIGGVGQDFYATTTTSGQPTNTTTYGPFGTADGTSGTPFGYAGQYAGGPGTPSGFTNMRARWYAAGTGTFTTVDPALAATNQPYEYAGGDPVNGSDPTGDSWWDPFSWSSRTWSTVGLIAGSIGLAATGFGVLADAGWLGEAVAAASNYTEWGGAISSGIAAGADTANCIGWGNQNACVGAVLGGIGTGFAVAGALTSSLALGFNAVAVGGEGLGWDALAGSGGSGAYAAPRPAPRPTPRPARWSPPRPAPASNRVAEC
jgi:RHS repeat-associated protein